MKSFVKAYENKINKTIKVMNTNKNWTMGILSCHIPKTKERSPALLKK